MNLVRKAALGAASLFALSVTAPILAQDASRDFQSTTQKAQGTLSDLQKMIDGIDARKKADMAQADSGSRLVPASAEATTGAKKGGAKKGGAKKPGAKKAGTPKKGNKKINKNP